MACDVAVAAFLISFGVLLGKVSPLQLIVMIIIEMPLFALNEHINFGVLQVRWFNQIICHSHVYTDSYQIYTVFAPLFCLKYVLKAVKWF